MEEVKKSLEASPIVKKGDYNYFVNPISDGVPAMDPKMLRELSLVVHKHADLDIDKIVAPTFPVKAKKLSLPPR